MNIESALTLHCHNSKKSPVLCQETGLHCTANDNTHDFLASQGQIASPLLPPPPPPSRETSVIPAENDPSLRMLESCSPRLAVSAASYRASELRRSGAIAPDTTYLESSGIRGSLLRSRGSQTKEEHKPIAEFQMAVTNRQLLGGATAIRPLSGLLNASNIHSSLNEADRQEQDAAITLLVLKDYSLHVSNMTKHWSPPLCKIPLCDFIVAQRKCQTMLKHIESLKDIKIQAREATAVEEEDASFHFMEELVSAKKSSADLYKSRSRVIPTRSSSIVSIVNAIQKDGDKEIRHESLSSDRTLTKSPMSSDNETPKVRSENYHLKPIGLYFAENEPKGLKISTAQLLEDGRKHISKVGKTSKSGKNRNSHMKCLHCAATDTPEWRKGPVGPTTLCNACGLFFKKLVKKFGMEIASVIMKSRQNENPQDRKVPRSFCA